MPVQKLKEFLDQNRVKYVSIVHSRAFTAQEVAESAHVSAKDLAKTIMVKADGRMVMTVLPADRKVDLNLLKEEIGVHRAQLATEEEFKDLFPDCEIGAMPPFGNLYGMPVYVAARLGTRPEIAFNAGSHTEAIRLAYADFQRLVQPAVVADCFC